VSFAAITLCVASQRVFIVVVVCFVIDSVRKLLNTPFYVCIRYVINFNKTLHVMRQPIGASCSNL
jgi:hypothetical protein